MTVPRSRFRPAALALALVALVAFGAPARADVVRQTEQDESIPAVIRQTPDGRTRIDVMNGRPDSVDVLLKARRLAAR